MTRLVVGAACFGVVTVALPAGLGSAAGTEASIGSWQTLAYDSQYTTIHAAVLRTGKVFIMAGSENIPQNLASGQFNAEVWDPKTGAMTQVRPPYDMFCSAHVLLADGKLLIAGGTEAYPTDEYVASGGASGVYFRGSKRANLFDPVTEQYQPVPDMAAGRWYPTLAGLGSGEVYATSGLDANSQLNTVPELYTQSSTGGSWRTTPSVSSSWPLYPHLMLLKNGKLFYSGGSIDNYNTGVLSPGILDVNTSQFTPVPGLSYADRREASTVLLPPAQSQKAMIVGGGDPAVNNVDIIDLSTSNPSYTPGPPMRSPRLHVSAILLADGKVFITGGGRFGRGDAPVFETEIYDPATNTMTPGADSSVPRVYHSVALLLPDGRVATAGGQPKYGERGELRIEVYSPPYLFKGTRPTISTAPTELPYGGQVSLDVKPGSKNGQIKALNLVRPASVTHSFDSEQRVVPMTFQVASSNANTQKLTAQVPQDRNLAPPGWYMLFAVNQQGVPSVASWVHLGDPGSQTTTTTTTSTIAPTTTTTTIAPTTTTTALATTTTTTTPPLVNALDADTAGLEGSTGRWAPWYSSNIARSTEQSHTGAASLRVDITASFGWGVTLNNWPGFPTSAGNKTISFWGRLGSGSNVAATMTVRWRNSAGSDLQVDTVSVPTLTTSWQQVSANVVAPTGTTNVSVELSSGSGTAGDYLYFDDFMVGSR